jgi:hypothetical protein
MQFLLLVIVGELLVGCDHPVHEAGLPVPNPPVAFVHPPTRVRLFMASVFKNQVVFDVFTWGNGHWKKSRSKEISPGDAIPGTDWSVLDVRDDLHGNGERYALLINIDGTVERHEVKSDSESPNYE